MKAAKQLCETCGKEAALVRRDVIDEDYDALTKLPLWNCEECYEKKRQKRVQERRGR